MRQWSWEEAEAENGAGSTSDDGYQQENGKKAPRSVCFTYKCTINLLLGNIWQNL